MISRYEKLDPSQRSNESFGFETALRERIVGQEEGLYSLVDLYQVFCAGMNSQGRPVGNLLFLGPTGSGKTRIVEAATEVFFGDPREHRLHERPADARSRFRSQPYSRAKSHLRLSGNPTERQPGIPDSPAVQAPGCFPFETDSV